MMRGERMTTEEAIVVLQKIKPIPHRGDGKSITHTLEIIAIDKAIKALEQQPCDDCISREAVDEYITNLLSGYLYDEERTRLEDLTTFIWELPSVQPTRPTARWIELGNEGLVFKCSLCGNKNTIESNYCPKCGARMGESEEEE